MRVLVLGSFVPFAAPCREAALFKHLVRNLQLSGNEAEGFRIPFNREPNERVIEEMLIARGLRISNVDRVIALNFPAYLAPWHDKMLWLGCRGLAISDATDEGNRNGSRHQQLEKAVRTADRIALAESQEIYTMAPVTSRRLLERHDVSSSTLRAPLTDPELFSGGNAEGYVLAPGRVSIANRQHLLVRALRHAPRARLIVAGPAETADADLLRRVAAEEGVEHRVMLYLQPLPRAQLARFVNGALAVACLPSEDNPLGPCYILEAFEAGKPVLTVSDSGDVLALVSNGECGLVVEPFPETLGHGLAALADYLGHARRLGEGGREAIRSAKLDWPTTIEKLTAPARGGSPRAVQGRVSEFGVLGQTRLTFARRIARARAALSGQM